MTNIGEAVQFRVSSQALLAQAESSQFGSDSFRDMLARMYNSSANIILDYSNAEDGEMIDLGRYGMVDPSNPGGQVAMALTLNDNQSELNTVLSYLDFIYRTLPQALDRAFS
ncbi:MAG: hypothetical protein ABIE84_05040 [bacterium]